MFNLFRALQRVRSMRKIRSYKSRVAAVGERAGKCAALDDGQLAAAASALRERARNGEKPDGLLPESFALAREAARRAIGQRPYDMQILGACVLFDSCIAEMKTGEGKTLAAVPAASLAAMCGMPVHIVTVNDYLAKRDAAWMSPAYAALGLSVGVNIPGSSLDEKRHAYRADITYGTSNEFGFDLLRDNMRHEGTLRLQRGHGYAIVDEVDSILIDEARTPLAISGPAGDLTQMYLACDKLTSQFRRDSGTQDEPDGHFTIDEKVRAVYLSDDGYELAEQLFESLENKSGGGLYDAGNLQFMHYLVAALRARHLYMRDRDYVVSNGRVVIVDEHTGRLIPGRRWGDGLHQAVEAKENCQIEQESQTLASVTLQNYFRMYSKLAGMTGTAQTEAEEFRQIYGLEAVTVPTHKPMVRKDNLDKIYRSATGKLRNVVADIDECRGRGQPVLVGTTSIEGSEQIAKLLAAKKIPHEVLNAKNHAREAEIIAQAGRPAAVTIATNMAGRGVDIILGGNIEHERTAMLGKENSDVTARANELAEMQDGWRRRHETVVTAGGLRIIGTERHESRRIDNQLRGRSGRQGDPGSSVFYLSFEDPLLRIFAAERISSLMEKLNIDEDDPIEAGMVTRVIENAQRKVEARNFDIRKQLLEYDDIINDQRTIIYAQREQILCATAIRPIAEQMAKEAVGAVCETHISDGMPEEQWDPGAAQKELGRILPEPQPVSEWLASDNELDAAGIAGRAVAATKRLLEAKNLEIGAEKYAIIQRMLILNVIDTHWRNHLAALEHLRMGIGLRGFAQKNPKQEYRREALEMFNTMLDSIRTGATRLMVSVRLSKSVPPPAARPPGWPLKEVGTSMPALPVGTPQAAREGGPAAVQPRARRNDPCPCGSGKKFKNCHGKLH